MKYKNIAFASKAGAGKDFVTNYLSKQYGYSRYAFADNVKLVAESWFPDLYGNGKEKPRWLLQKIGTMFREIDEDVWIKSLFKSVDEENLFRKYHGYSQEFIAITDCRMPNEYEALKDRGFVFIRVDADDAIREERMLTRGDVFKKEDMNHHTESFYDSFECDYVIDNNGSAEELYEKIDEVMELIIKEAEM